MVVSIVSLELNKENTQADVLKIKKDLFMCASRNYAKLQSQLRGYN